jgi:hypothetical protein
VCSAAAVGTGRRTANDGARSAVARVSVAWGASGDARGGEGVVNRRVFGRRPELAAAAPWRRRTARSVAGEVLRAAGGAVAA